MDENNKIPAPQNQAEKQELAALKTRYSEHTRKFGAIDLKQLFPEADDKIELLEYFN